MTGYQIYNPTVTSQTVINPYTDPSGLTYVANASLAYYGGKFWAVLDGTTTGFVEASAGQQIWMTTSTDGVTWSTPFQPFRDSTYCNNVMTGSALEWQPNLVVVGTELWCTWSGTGTDGYISKLTGPSNKWTNYRFEWVGLTPYISSTITGANTSGRSNRATIGGVTDLLFFPSQNPVVLSTGVVCCPGTFESATLSTQTTASNTFTKALKWNAILKTTDGINWSAVTLNTTSFGDFCPWEPFVVENPAGHIYVYSRNLDARVADSDFMLVNRSTDGGNTFSPAVSAKMLVPSSRGFAQRTASRRWVMAHMDHFEGSDQTVNQALSSKGRSNGALFMSRRGNDDFIPGVNFSGTDSGVNYPQFIVGPSGNDLYICYTCGAGNTVRASLKVVRVTPLPDDNYAYVHPRSVAGFTQVVATDPTLNSTAPAYYDFNGNNQTWSTTALTGTSSGVTFTAWLSRNSEGDVLMDSRSGANGQVFRTIGLFMSGANYFHNLAIPAAVPVFLAAVIDNTADTVTFYLGTGTTSFQTVTGYYKSILFAGQPANLDTVTLNGVVYTFKTTPTLTNDVAIGASTAITITNLQTKVNANSMQSFAPGTSRLIMARSDIATFTVSSGSSQVTVESGFPLDGGPVSFGFKASLGSQLSAYVGRMYEGRVYTSPLSQANLTSLYNAKAATFGYPSITGVSTVPGSPLLLLDPANPNLTQFPSVGTAPYCEQLSSTSLRIHGEASASVELPYGATVLTIRYKIGAVPTSTDKYVIASFGDAASPVRLYVNAANPTSLYANGRLVAAVADPTIYSTVTITVSANKINIGSFEQYFSGKPRCFLGSAYPEGLLSVSKTVDYDISAMTAIVATMTLINPSSLTYPSSSLYPRG